MPCVPPPSVKRAGSVVGTAAAALIGAAVLYGPSCLQGASAGTGSSGKGSAVGRIIDAGTGFPLQEAVVRLLGIPGRDIPPGRSRDSGTFEFTEIPAGDYAIHAERPGYLECCTGAVLPPVTVLPGRRTTGLVVRLHPEASIRGHVLDAAGTGVAHAWVRAFAAIQGKLLEIESGKATASGAFVIGRLPAGSYVLLAAPPSPFGAPTYYPSSPGFDAAVSIEIREAERVSGIRITLVAGPAGRVRGTAQDVRGVLDGRRAAVYLVPRSARGTDLAALAWKAPLGPLRTFEFHGVPAGQYTVQLIADSPDRRILAARVAIIGPAGADDLRLYPEPPLALRGRVSVSGFAPRDLSRVRISLHPAPSAAGFCMSVDALAGREGHFVARGLEPTSYALLVQAPPDLFVERVLLGRRVVPGRVLNLGGVTAGSSLEIRMRDGAARLSGAVRTTSSSERRQAGMRVAVLYPVASSPGDPRRSIAPIAGNRFEFSGVAPGRYKVFATDRFDPALFAGPTFLDLISGQVHAVELRRHEHGRTDVRLIDAQRVEAAARRAGPAGF